MSEIVLSGVTKTFPGGVKAVDGISLTIESGEFMVLVGPSGCGKTTLLRMIAGLETVDDGSVRVGDRDITGLEPRDRDIAMVFQDYALYPHMSVRDNLSYGLRVRKTPKREIEARVDEVAELLGLHDLLDRLPAALSGGQRQRVAMGRAIARRPQVYLMDEPLSNLDAKLRVRVRADLARLHAQLGVTTVYVTHDQVEAMQLGHRSAVMRDGRILQVGRPQTLYRDSANLFVASFIGSPSMNLVRAELEGDAVHFLPATACRSTCDGARRREAPRRSSSASGPTTSKTPASLRRACRRSTCRSRSSRTSVPRRSPSSPSTPNGSSPRSSGWLRTATTRRR